MSINTVHKQVQEHHEDTTHWLSHRYRRYTRVDFWLGFPQGNVLGPRLFVLDKCTATFGKFWECLADY